MIVKPYPKDIEPRTFGVRPEWVADVAEHIRVNRIGRDDLLFSTEAASPGAEQAWTLIGDPLTPTAREESASSAALSGTAAAGIWLDVRSQGFKSDDKVHCAQTSPGDDGRPNTFPARSSHGRQF
jgi:hypothetical protein